MNSKKNEQHTIPRTYLKHWRIAEGQNLVCIVDFHNKYRTEVQTVGLNDKVFKSRKYYNDNSLKNPYLIEELLGEDFEPNYEIIMNEVKKEQSLSESVRVKLLGWLYVSKMRSPVMRANPERIANFMYKAQECWNGSVLTEERERELKEKARKLAKKVQLSALSDETQVQNLLKLFVDTLVSKHWRILKSTPAYEFWTNDNPGFSPNMIERFAKDRPYHHVMEMNGGSYIYYPLSPKYCLEIIPFEQGTPLHVSAMTMDIKFEQAPLDYIDFINRGVFHTCYKLLISNNKELLERCIK